MNLRPLQLAGYGLRQELRLKSGFAIRALILGVLCFCTYFTLLEVFQGGFRGPALFAVLTWVNWLSIYLIGVSSFAGTIAEERERRTLGLLRLAGFQAWAVILGKSLGSLVSYATILLVQIPFVLLCLVLGGVSWVQFEILAQVLIAHLFLMFCIGVYASVRRPTLRQAIRTAQFLGALVLFGGYVFAAISSWLGLDALKGMFFAWAQVGSLPVVNLMTTSVASFTVSGLPGEVLLYHLLLGLAFLGLALRNFEQAVQEAPRKGLAAKVGVSLRTRAAREVRGDALRWQHFWYVAGGKWGLYVRILIPLGICGLVIAEQSRLDLRDIGGVLAFTGLFAFAIDMALQCEALFRPDLRQKTWGAVYALPGSLGELVFARLRAAVLMSTPFLCSLGLGLVLLGGREFYEVLEGIGEGIENGVIPLLVGNFVLVCCVAAQQSARQRAGGAILAILVVFLLNFLAAVAIDGLGIGRGAEEFFCWLGGGIALALCFPVVADTRRQLDKAAAQE